MPEAPGAPAGTLARLGRSTSLRLAAGYALLFAVSSLVLVAVVWWSTAGYLDREIDAVIVAEADGLADQARAGGLPALAAAIQERVAHPLDPASRYLLADAALRRIAGNVEAWPLQAGRASGWHTVEAERGGRPAALRLLHVVLPGGIHVLVGRDVAERERVRGLVLNALLIAGAITAVLAIAGGIAMRRLVMGRVDSIRRAADAIVRGDLTRRVASRGSGDELDLLAESINRMLAQIETLMAGMRNVTNSVAHDLRTPLTELRARLELLATAEAGGAPDMDGAIAALDRIIGIFNALLRIAEIDSGARRAGFAAVDLAAVARDAAELYAALADARGLALTVEADGPAKVVGDRQLLAQALGNLIDNAVKNTPAGGTVGVRAGLAAGQARVEVSDTGPGIPAAEREKVLQPFYRGDRSRSTPGTGLGLSLVDAVARLHDGDLMLEDSGSDASPGLRAVLSVPGIPAEGE